MEKNQVIHSSRCQSGKFRGNLLIHLNPIKVAEFYYSITKDSDANNEFTNPARFARDLIVWEKTRHGSFTTNYRPGWYESTTRKRAMNRDHKKDYGIPRGTWIADWLFVACEKKLAPTHVLSQVLWWFSNKKNTNGQKLGPRARIKRRGHLWIAKSHRQLSQETGIPGRTVRRCIDYLVNERSLLIADYWVFNRKRDRNQKTLHLRPNVEKNDAVLSDIDVEEEVFNIEKYRMGKYC